MRPHRFHAALPGYAPSPLLTLASDTIEGVEVMLKLETARFGLPSFKVLGASWATCRAVADHFDIDVQGNPEALAPARLANEIPVGQSVTIEAATDGNHGRAVAWTARQLRLPAVIRVPKGTAESRIGAIEAEGASVHVVDGDYEDAVAAAATAASTPGHLLVQDVAVTGSELVTEWVVDGYGTIFDELDVQLTNTSVDAVIVPVGVGSLALAAVRHHRGRDSRALVISVEPCTAGCLHASLQAGRRTTVAGPHHSTMAGLNCGEVSEAAWPELRTGVDRAVLITDDQADAAMRDLADDGIMVGECGAAPLAALRQLLSAPPTDLPTLRTVVLVATEGPTDPERWSRVTGLAPADVTRRRDSPLS